MTIDYRKVVTLTTYQSPYVEIIYNTNGYQVTDTVTRYTKPVFLIGDEGPFADAVFDLKLATTLSLTDSVSGNNLVTFSRASSGTYVGSDGLIKTSPVNLLIYSEQFNRWTNASGVTANTSISPDGSQTADTVPQQSNSANCVARTVLVSSGLTCTFSVYLKQGTSSTTGIQFTGGAAGIDETIFLDFDTESVDNGSVENAGNGWYRISKTVTAAGDANPSFRVGIGTGTVFAWGAQVEEGTTATDYIPTGATINGAPRFDHDPTTGESLGLLIEESRTNIVDRNTSNWSSIWSNASPGGAYNNAGIAPDGTNTAFSTTTYAPQTRGQKNYVVPADTSVYTFSIFIKSTGGQGQYVTYKTGFVNGDQDTSGQVAYDFSTDTVGHGYSRKIYANGWVRIWKSYTNANQSAFLTTNNQLTSLDMLFWGAQLEIGSTPSSLIVTPDGVDVTRAADVATIEGTNFSSWYNQSEGTLFVELGSDQGVVPTRYQLSDAGGSNRLQSRKDQLYCFNGTQQFNLAYTSSLKEASAFSGTSTSVAVSGSVVATHGAASLPTCTNIELGKRGGNFDYLNGHISRLSYFPTRKTDEDLIKLTT